MFEKVLSKNAKESLGLLGKTSILKNAYLAGGTAAALRLGHRESKDLDFFSEKKFSEKDLLKKLRKNLPKRFQGVDVADLRDIAAMKIAAISDRGTKRDFVDLYFFIINKIATLEECLDLYDRKFKTLQQNEIHIIKSLSYFADADVEEMPKVFQPISWKEIKRFLEREVRYLSRRLLL